VTRWLSSDGRHFPRDEERILALAGALDVDPTALWTFDAENFPTLWPKIVRAARTGRWSGLLKALAFFRYFSDQAEEWPPQQMARRFFNREWVVNEFSHDPATARTSTRTSSCAPPPAGDRSDGVALRVPPRRRARREVAALRIRAPRRGEGDPVQRLGDHRRGGDDAVDQDICIRTWFGQGAAAFRIVALHPFTLSIPKLEQPGLPTVHFGFPARSTKGG
jgi:hypothetical protein